MQFSFTMWANIKTTDKNDNYLSLAMLHASIFTRVECTTFTEVDTTICDRCGHRHTNRFVLCLKSKCTKSRQFIEDYTKSDCYKYEHYRDVQFNHKMVREITNTAAEEVMDRNKVSYCPPGPSTPPPSSCVKRPPTPPPSLGSAI